jgi:hypothetical protein
MKIYTAHYRYGGDDRLDITVKGNTPPGSVLAPTWEMVKGYQKGTITQWDYATRYFSLIVERMHTINSDKWRIMLDDVVADRKQLTLVCFCPAGQFCHRILAARMLENMGYGTYVGEWNIC